MSDRLEDEIHGFIKNGNFKGCVEKVSKLRKQLPNSSYLRILEVYVKFKQSPGKFDYEASLGKLFGMNGVEVTSDIRALNLLHKFFIELERYEEALHIYESASFKYPGFEVALQWFEKSLDDGNYKQMTKACQQLAKTGGDKGEGLKSRDYHFWHALSIVSMFRFQSQRLTDQEKKLLPQLAYRSLCSLKPFQSAQEVYVFCAVCEELFEGKEKSQEIVQEVLPQLQSSVDLHLKNYLLRNFDANDHDLSFKVCSSLLKEIDDFEVMTFIIRAEHALGKPKEDVTRHIKSLVGDSRNSRLARLEVDSIYEKQIFDDALDHYLQKYHNKPCCPVDLSRYKQLIDNDQLMKAFKKLESTDAFHDTNLFKLGISDLSPIDGYAKHKGSLKTKAETDYSPLSAYILKIVSDLILVPKDPPIEKVVLALNILENYRNYDPYNYDTSVWLVALYIYLGCIPLAYERYLQLKVKSVQVDTTDFLMFSHFSTLFPSKPHSFIQNVQDNLQRFYHSSTDRLPQFIQICLERKSYSKFLGMLEFKDRLERSVMRWSLVSENIQLSRLCNDKRSAQLQTMHERWRKLEASGSQKFFDNRDWEIFSRGMSREKLPKVLQYLHMDDNNVALKCAREFMIELIPLRQNNAKLDSYLEEICPDGVDSALDGCLEPSDAWSFRVFHDLYKNEGNNLLFLLEQMNSKDLASGSWQLSHEYLMRLQTLKTLDSFKRIKDSIVKRLIKKMTNQLREKCDDLYCNYINQVKAAFGKLNSGESGKLLNSLDFSPIDSQTIEKALLTVQKTVRNL